MSTACRTLAEVLAAADRAAAELPPMSQETADLVAAILASRTRTAAAA